MTTCPASTPVGMICPNIWRLYGPSLGATGAACGKGDAGDGGGDGSGCSCGVTARGGGRGGRGAGDALIAGLVVAALWRGRRQREAGRARSG